MTPSTRSGDRKTRSSTTRTKTTTPAKNPTKPRSRAAKAAPESDKEVELAVRREGKRDEGTRQGKKGKSTRYVPPHPLFQQLTIIFL
jgi:hypothetical protein